MSSSSPQKLAYWFVFQNDRLLISMQTDMKLLTTTAISSIETVFSRQYLLANVDEYEIYCAELSTAISPPPEVEVITMRQALELLGTDWHTLAVKAYSIINWDKNHQFCGRCGQETVYKAGAFERVCTACSLSFYPRISPSIIVLIYRENQVLMARGPHFPKGAYALIAGFVEAGESIEEAVHREVKEETNLQVKNVRYFGSQSWPFPDSLMIGFIAEYASGELKFNPQEIEDGGWYPFNHIPGRPTSSLSIASQLINYFIATKGNMTQEPME